MDGEWPAEMFTYNEKFTKMIEAVKRRHDPVVTTVGKSGMSGRHDPYPVAQLLPYSVFDSPGQSELRGFL